MDQEWKSLKSYVKLYIDILEENSLNAEATNIITLYNCLSICLLFNSSTENE